MPGPLQGIRVLDLTRVLAGPMATQTLADLGAEVIKIERPKTGDDTRGWGPPFLDEADAGPTSGSTYFACCNRGKKSVTVDLSTAVGQDIVRRLAQQCDVLAENYKVGDLQRYGLDYPRLRALNPRLVYCSITGYGQSGPYSARPGYDPIAQAMGGLMSVTGERDGAPGGGPQRVGVAVTDMMTAIYAVSGILAALLHRHGSGEGQHIDLALLDVQVASMINIAQAYLSAGIVARRNGNVHPSVVPSQVFECADGQLMLAAGNDSQFAKLCDAVGRPEIARDARCATNDARVRNRELVISTLETLMRNRPVAYWTEKLAAAGVPCGPINDISAVFADPQVRHRGMRVEVVHPVVGALALVGNPLRLSETAVEYRLPPPLLGEHTDEVLAGLLDMDRAEIERLRREMVV
ncbi:MAG TPA: CaiB/BaiF CoA-transferase family protein [Burkholderiales bacterium]|nr:CaiB/BaiF CoA-transferase family protein [Burkholderiales bacterium]